MSRSIIGLATRIATPTLQGARARRQAKCFAARRMRSMKRAGQPRRDNADCIRRLGSAAAFFAMHGAFEAVFEIERFELHPMHAPLLSSSVRTPARRVRHAAARVRRRERRRASRRAVRVRTTRRRATIRDGDDGDASAAPRRRAFERGGL